MRFSRHMLAAGAAAAIGAFLPVRRALEETEPTLPRRRRRRSLRSPPKGFREEQLGARARSRAGGRASDVTPSLGQYKYLSPTLSASLSISA